jgi:ATP phosphoribosyltransferase
MKKLRLALPKGSLQEATFQLFERAGYRVTAGARSYVLNVDDDQLEAMLFRAQEISRYVEQGVVDAGITGLDWILENGSKIKEAADLFYAKSGTGRVRWVLAAPEGSKIRKPQDLEGKRVATELVQVTKKYFRKRGVNVGVEFSWGATEVKAPAVVDAIVDCTETGDSLRAHRLRIVDTVLESNTKFIANHDAWKDPWKRQKIEDMVILLEGALDARGKVGLKMNLPQKSIADVRKVMPAMKSPTISPLSEKGWVALEVIVDKQIVREIVPRLKKAGARDIIEYPLTKVIK